MNRRSLFGLTVCMLLLGPTTQMVLADPIEDDFWAIMSGNNQVQQGGGTGWVDQIVTQGFDAAYLDIVDAYYFWGAEVDPGDQVPGDPTGESDAAERMIDFVVDITAHARATNPDFFVIPQNGGYILADLQAGSPDPTRVAAYRDAIGAIGVEDMYFRGGADENNPYDPDTDRVNILKDDFLDAGVPVLTVEYLNDPTMVDSFFDVAVDDGFMPYAAPSRALDVLGVPLTVPEPASLALLALGGMALVCRRRGRGSRD